MTGRVLKLGLVHNNNNSLNFNGRVWRKSMGMAVVSGHYKGNKIKTNSFVGLPIAIVNLPR
jgi:hypothetical protein